jgi:uncharacterized membrane protein
MKGIDSIGAHLVHAPGWMHGWVDGWMEVKVVLGLLTAIKNIFGIFECIFMKLAHGCIRTFSTCCKWAV